MAYYNKHDIENHIREELLAIEKDESVRVLTPISQPLTQLKNEEDLVGFCYTTVIEKDGQKLPKMHAKVYLRIDYDLYTDDRFAIDQFQATQDGKTVSEVVKERHQAQQRAIRELTGEDLKSISELYERAEMVQRKSGKNEGV